MKAMMSKALSFLHGMVSRIQKSLLRSLPITKRILYLLTTACLVVICLKLLQQVIISYDVWWHLANGRYMIEHGIFLREDVFSHTLHGTAWTNFEWLFQIIIYLLVKMADVQVLYILKYIFVISITMLLLLLLMRTACKPLMLLPLMWMGFINIHLRGFVRPELFSYIFFALCILLVLEAREKGGAWLRRLPWAASIMMILWVNIHAGYVYGIGVFALLLGGALWNKENPSFIRSLALTLLVSSLSLGINPFGYKILYPIIEHLSFQTHTLSLVDEFTPTPTKDMQNFWIMYACTGIGLVYGTLKKVPGIRFWTPATLLFLIWGSVYIRNIAISAFIALPFFGWLVSSCLTNRRYRHITLALIMLLGVSNYKIISKKWTDTRPMRNSFPERACEFVSRVNIQGNMFNSYGFGGYIAWRLGPDRKIFMDGRYIFLPLLEKLNHLRKSEGSLAQTISLYQEFFSSHNVAYAICRYQDSGFKLTNATVPFHLSVYNVYFPRSQWALIYWDDTALVFVKRDSMNDAIVKLYEYRYVWPHNPNQMMYLLREGIITKDQVRKELVRAEKSIGPAHLINTLKSRLDTI